MYPGTSARAAAAERTRVAREMHDIVGHNLAVMVGLADGAATLARTDPARSADAMTMIASTGRQALGELRRVLGVLRDEPQAELSPQPGIGEAGHGAEAVRMAAELRPDVVLMDVRMPGMDGIEATRRIVGSGERSRVIILTTFDLDEYAYAALRAGASGFLLKDALPEELLAGIRAVSSGDAVVAPGPTRRLLDTFAHRLPRPPGDAQAAGDPRLASLSDREREVLVAIGQGWTNQEICDRLVLTESTVKKHVGRVLPKLGARDRVQGVILAYDTGLVRPGEPPA